MTDEASAQSPGAAAERYRDERLAALEREIERLHGCVQDLDRDLRSARHTWWGLLFVLPAGYLMGPLGAALALLFTVSLWSTAIYLVGVRRREYMGLIDQHRRDQERVKRRLGASAGRSEKPKTDGPKRS